MELQSEETTFKLRSSNWCRSDNLLLSELAFASKVTTVSSPIYMVAMKNAGKRGENTERKRIFCFF